MAGQDFPLLDQLYNDLSGIDFDEIAKEATEDCVMQDGNLGLHFDNTKITQAMSEVTMGLPLPPSAVVVQAPSPFPGLQEQYLQPSSPEIELVQPVSPGALEEPDTSMDLHTALSSLSPDPGYVQVASPVPCPVQPAGPVHQYTLVVLPSQLSVISTLPPFPVPMEEETEVLPAHPLVNEAAAFKKRGGRNKSEDSTSRRHCGRKPKVYEMGPKVDPKEEKKRKRAVTAKLHRDKQKNERDSLATQLQQVTVDNDRLKRLVEQLQNREAQRRV